MLDIAEIITYLKTACPALNGNVFGSAELGAVQSQAKTFPTPCAFVLQEDEDAQDMTVSDFTQLITAQFVVVLAVRNVVDSRGESAHLQLQPLAMQLKSALHGIRLTDAASHTRYTKGKRLSHDNALLSWAFMFKTEYIS